MVLTDFKLPEFDGIELVKQVRGLPHCVDIPIVVITVVDDRQVRYNALEAGATELRARVALSSSASMTRDIPVTLNASIGTGVQIGGNDLNGFGAHLKICFGDNCTTNPVTLFDSSGATPTVNATFSTDADGGHDLLNSLTNATSFSNAGPNEIISMLGQVAGFFTSIAGQGFLAQQIPFTTMAKPNICLNLRSSMSSACTTAVPAPNCDIIPKNSTNTVAMASNP